MVEYQPPPTWASVILEQTDPATGEKRPTFSPVWLKWFIDLAALLTGAGGGSGTIGDVRGPAASVLRDIAVYADTTGKVLIDSAVKVDNVVQGPAVAINGNVAVFDGTTGKRIKDGGGAPAVLSSFVDAETPTGLINSANVTFTLAHPPSPGASLFIYHNDGSPYIGGGVHYTLIGSTVTFQVASTPQTGDLLRANYRY